MGKGDVTMSVKGLKEAYKMLEDLPLKTKAKELRIANRKGATKVIANALKSENPKYRRAFKVKGVRGEPTAVTVGAVSGGGGGGYLLRWKEYGTKKRKLRKSGANRGTFKAKPFFRALVKRKTKPLISFIAKEYGDITNNYLTRRIKAVNRAANRK